MARRGEHSLEEIKGMVLSAAELIVVNEGIKALTVRKIAQRVGYTVGSIYMVYENLGDLVVHINGRTLDQIDAELEQAQADASEGCGVEAIAKAYCNYARNNVNRWNLIFDYRLPEDKIIPDWYQKKVDAIFAKVEAQFAKLHQECPEAKKKHAARTLWAGVHGVCVLSLRGQLDFVGVDDVEESVVSLVRYFIHGWLGALA